jgi:hypothetical protein
MLGADFDRFQEIQTALNLIRIELVNRHLMRLGAVRTGCIFTRRGRELTEKSKAGVRPS